MPWKCKKCQTEVMDSEPHCPNCKEAKTSWTILPEATRTFVMAPKKVEYLRGVSEESYAGQSPSEELEIAERAWVLPKAVVRDLADRNHMPAPRHVLTARLYPRQAKNWDVKLGILYDYQGVDQQDFPFEGPRELSGAGYADQRFLFVYGEEEPSLDDVRFEGIHHVVEISEHTPEGQLSHAPAVRIAALGKKAKKLPIEAIRTPDKAFIRVLLFDEDGDPASELEYLIEDLEGDELFSGTTDEEGRIDHEPVELGDYLLSLPELRVLIAAVAFPEERVLVERPTLGHVRARVLDAELSPLANAAFQIQDGRSRDVASGSTDAAGCLAHDNVPLGDYTLRVAEQVVRVPAVRAQDEQVQVFLGATSSSSTGS
jgi:hypothetical protein